MPPADGRSGDRRGCGLLDVVDSRGVSSDRIRGREWPVLVLEMVDGLVDDEDELVDAVVVAAILLTDRIDELAPPQPMMSSTVVALVECCSGTGLRYATLSRAGQGRAGQSGDEKMRRESWWSFV